jgi:hypothetical protein
MGCRNASVRPFVMVHHLVAFCRLTKFHRLVAKVRRIVVPVHPKAGNAAKVRLIGVEGRRVAAKGRRIYAQVLRRAGKFCTEWVGCGDGSENEEVGA